MKELQKNITEFLKNLENELSISLKSLDSYYTNNFQDV